jgi:predicted DNA-binding ribbon-helix-helix protein
MSLMVTELAVQDRFVRRRSAQIAHAGTKLLERPTNFLLRRPAMRSTVVKRSIVIAGHKTSVSLEDAFWKSLREIAVGRGTTLSNLVTSIDVERQQGNLSSCLRLFVLDFYRYQLIEARNARAATDAGAIRPARTA